MPDHFHIRPYQPSDEHALLTVWNTAMWADPIDALTWRTTFLLDPSFDEDACLLAEIGDDVVGFVFGLTPHHTGPSPNPHGDGWIIGIGVLPDYRRQGIGTALVRALQQQWHTQDVGTIHIGPWVPTYLTPGIDVAAYADAIAFFNALGGREGGRPVSMKANLTNYMVQPDIAPQRDTSASEGIIFRDATGKDILPLLAFMDAHFPHWTDYARESLRMVASGMSTTATVHVVEDSGEIIGYAQSVNERFGPFGVNEAYRGRGIGGVLLSRTLVAMRQRGFHTAWFLWTSDRTARLYNKHGFEEVRRFAMMDLPATIHSQGDTR